MTYKSVWWYPNYIEYGTGLNAPKTWPKVPQQYQRPHALYDLRYYDLPEEQYEERLLYRLPRLGMPQYRALFRDHPHTVPRHYPDVCPEGQPPGFHGRVYYEDGPPQFKYQGRKKDEAYWLERGSCLPVMDERRWLAGRKNYESYRGINQEKVSLIVDARGSPYCGCANNYYGISKVNEPSSRFVRSTSVDGIKRQTQDGVGLL